VRVFGLVANHRGTTLLIVLVSAALLCFLLTLLTGFLYRIDHQLVDMDMDEAVYQVEDALKTSIFQTVRKYLGVLSTYGLATNTECNDSLLLATDRFQAQWSSPIAGITLNYLDATGLTTLQNDYNALPVLAFVSPAIGKYETAIVRCAQQSLMTLPDLKNETGIYFCLRLGLSQQPREIAGMQPAFLEARFLPLDARSDGPIQCRNLAPFVTPGTAESRRLLGTLFYSFYYTRLSPKGRIYKRRSNLFALGG